MGPFGGNSGRVWVAGATWRRWRRRVAAVVGVAALAAPLWPAAVLAPPAAEGAVAAPALEWQNVRPPQTDMADSDGSDGYHHLPSTSISIYDGGSTIVPHPLAVAPNGDLFVAGGGAGFDVDGGGCGGGADASPDGSVNCLKVRSTRPVVSKSTDGGNAWRTAYLPDGVGAGGTLSTSAFIRKIVVSPNYPRDPFVAVVFTAQDFALGSAQGTVGSNVNGFAWSVDGGFSFNAHTGDGAGLLATVDWLTIALTPNFNWTDSTGVVVIGGQVELGSSSVYAANTISLQAFGSSIFNLGAFSASTTADVGAPGSQATLDLAFSAPAGLGLARLHRVTGSPGHTYTQVTTNFAFAAPVAGEELLVSGGPNSFAATRGAVAFADTYVSGGAFYTAAGDAPNSKGGTYRFNGTGWAKLVTACDGFQPSDMTASGSGGATKLVVAYGAAIDRICRSSDDGATWAETRVENFQNMGCFFPSCPVTTSAGRLALLRGASSTVYWSGDSYTTGSNDGALAPGVARSTDNGTTWQDTGLAFESYVTTVTRQGNADRAFALMQTRNPAGAASGALFVTSNYGPNAAWRRSLNNQKDDLNLSPLSPTFATDNVAYARRGEATLGPMLKTSNGGGTWAPTTADPFAAGPVSQELAFSDRTLNGAIVYVGGSKGHVSLSHSGGAVWVVLAQDFGGNVYDVRALDTLRTKLLVTALDNDNVIKLWLSTDSGGSFSVLGSPASAWGQGPSSPSAFGVHSLGLDGTGNGVLVVVAGRGDGDISNPDIYRYDLTAAGASWVRAGTNTNFSGSTAFKTFFQGDGWTLALLDSTNRTLYRTVYPTSITAAAWPRQRMATYLPASLVMNAGKQALRSCEDVSQYSWCLQVTAGGRVQQLVMPDDFVAGASPFSPGPGSTIPTNVGDAGVPTLLRWLPVVRAACYEVQVSLSDNFDGPLLDGTASPLSPGCGSGPGVSTSASYQITASVFAFAANQSYWWRARVRASDASIAAGAAVGPTGSAVTGPWSPSRFFSVVPAGTSFLSLSPASGNPGWNVSATGSLFVSSETVQVFWDAPAALLRTALVDGNGGFTASIDIPATAPAGVHIVRAVGGSSGRQAIASFLVTVPGAPAATFQGQVKIGVPGGGEAAPPAGYQVQVFTHNTGVVTPLNTQLVQTDGNGVFAITIASFSAGNYDLRVKGSHTVSRRMTTVALPQVGGAAPLNFGTLPTGDLSGDDSVLGVDYSALVSNFGLSGPLAVSGGVAAFRGSDDTLVRVRLASDTGAIEAGATFRVEVVVESGRLIDAMDVVLRYAPDRLTLVDADGRPTSGARRGDGLPVVLRNRADGATGTLEFSSGALPGEPVQGTLTVATLYFTALSPLSGSALPLRLEYGGTPRTAVYYRGEAAPAQ